MWVRRAEGFYQDALKKKLARASALLRFLTILAVASLGPSLYHRKQRVRVQLYFFLGLTYIGYSYLALGSTACHLRRTRLSA